MKAKSTPTIYVVTLRGLWPRPARDDSKNPPKKLLDRFVLAMSREAAEARVKKEHPEATGVQGCQEYGPESLLAAQPDATVSIGDKKFTYQQPGIDPKKVLR